MVLFTHQCLVTMSEILDRCAESFRFEIKRRTLIIDVQMGVVEKAVLLLRVPLGTDKSFYVGQYCGQHYNNSNK